MGLFSKTNNIISYTIDKNFSGSLAISITNGEVANSDLKKYTGKDAINLEELLTIFKAKYSSEFDFKELEKCIYYHEMDKELRKRILELVALKLLYSPNTLPKYGYKRAKRFINEFNQKLNLNLSSEKIDEIMTKNTTEENLPYTPALIKPL